RLGSPPHLRALGEERELRSLRVELAKQDAAEEQGSGVRTRAPTRPARLLEDLPPSAGFRLFGRRGTPDGYSLGRLAWPAVGPAERQGQFTQTQTADGRDVRGLPRGLDLMAVLGSDRARALLAELGDDAYRAGGGAPGYDSALQVVRREFAALD